MIKRPSFCFLSGNMLKFIAAFTMVIDHLGFFIFKDIILFRIIGRITFPIFAYLIAEGCRYTKNKSRYFLTIFGIAFICQFVYAVFSNDYSMCVLVTFSLAILVVYALDNFKVSIFSSCSVPYKLLNALFLVIAIVITYLMNYYFTIEYGFWGCMLPAIVSICHTPKVENPPEIFKILDTNVFHILMVAISLVFITINARLGWEIQIFCFLSLPILFLYSGKRGKLKTKYFFYLFYPIHLVVLEGIAILIKILN